MRKTYLHLSPLLAIIGLLWTSCSGGAEREVPTIYSFPIEGLTDADYPDDPDRDLRASHYSNELFIDGTLRMVTDSLADLELVLNEGGRVTFKGLQLSEWIPTVPEHLRKDSYLSFLSVLNQEWNRNQVAFRKGDFESSEPSITRVDIARNCLNAYLWEVIAYTEEDGHEKPLGHGWFDFPAEPYQHLFAARNGVPFSTYAEHLEHWKDPVGKRIVKEELRTVLESIPIRATDHCRTPYPLSGERAKKRKEVVHPAQFTTMRDLCRDSTTFATFSPPGIYLRADPRRTQLGRFHHLVSATMERISVPGSEGERHALDLLYSDQEGTRLTHFVVGGVDLSRLPVLREQEANSAWACSMGFGNHPFYESRQEHEALHTRWSSYHAYLTDAESVWLDSHAVGIDGPLMHFSDEERRTLHVWLLSFERHALVGHVVVELQVDGSLAGS